jgi:hypothetical protein
MNNSLFVLMGLLALSYLGGLLVNKRGGASAIGMPAGLEYVAVGFVLSPTLLGVVERSVLDLFSPLVQVALAWLTLLIGLEFGKVGGKNIAAPVVLAALLGAGLTIALSAGGTYLLLTHFPTFFSLGEKTPPWLVASGLGIATCETTRHAVRWVLNRYRTDGPVSELLHGFAATSDVVPLGALAIMFAFTDHGTMKIVNHVVGPLDRVVITLLLGVLLGLVALVLVGKRVNGHAVWGAFLGTALLGVGVAQRLGLSDLTVTFVEGVTIAILSEQRNALRKLLGPTERAVMLPTLLLAGTRLDFTVIKNHWHLILIVLFVLFSRALTKWISGLMLTAASSDVRASGGSIGAGLMSAGALSIALGLTIAMRFPSAAGDLILITAALAVAFGELFAPRALRRLLDLAGEMDQARPSMTTVPPPAVSPTDEHAEASHS